VTGASGGLGRAFAIGFGRAGYQVAVNYHTKCDEAVETRRAIEKAGGTGCAYQADIRDSEAVSAMVAAIMDRWGRLDVLVCNAAISKDEFVVRVSEESWDTVVDTILTGTFHCLRSAGAIMQRQGAGVILLIGSFAGIHGRPGQAPYAAAKAGLLGLMKSLAREWGQGRIRINMILPGWHPTALTGFRSDCPSERDEGPVLGHGTTLEAVSAFAVTLAMLPNVSGQVFNLDSRITIP
jgi:3-oxoacyl-[acyl-carrier protein] reductase